MKSSAQTSIRLAEASDIETLARLFDAWNVGPQRGEETDLLNQLTLVAEKRGRVIGCISALVGPSNLAYVDNLAVDPASSSPLVAHKLLASMERLLARLGWSSIQACVSSDRPRLIAYAERLGYVDYGLHHIIGKSLASGSKEHG